MRDVFTSVSWKIQTHMFIVYIYVVLTRISPKLKTITHFREKNRSTERCSVKTLKNVNIRVNYGESYVISLLVYENL